MIVDTINVRGDVTLSLYDGKGGALKHQVEVRNLVTTAGKNYIVRKMFGDTETVARVSIGAGTTYVYNIVGSTTVITGLDSTSKVLRYTPGKVTVTKNNATLATSAYVATSGSSITLASPAGSGDVIRVFSAVVAAADTALEGELAKAAIQFQFIDQVDTNLIHYITTFEENIGTGIIREVGLLSNSTYTGVVATTLTDAANAIQPTLANTRKLLCRTALTTPFVKAATDYLVVNWKLQIG